MGRFHLGELSITSPAFADGGRIPDRHVQADENVSPELHIAHVPEGTQSLALVCHDPDAPVTHGWVHWITWDIAPDTTVIPEGVTGLPAAVNDSGNAQWDGPAPPGGHGTHHYFFHLYALDAPVDPPADVSFPAFLALIDEHIIEQARLVGTYHND